MKISGARIQSFLRQPSTDTAAILLFGPDRGLVRERAQDVGKTAAPDLSDPFRVVQFSGQDLKADAARLIDEAAQFSMTGGRRLIWINEATDAVTSIFKDFLETGQFEALVIVEAGVLGARSTLRKLFEKSKNAAAIGCYEDDGQALHSVIHESLARYGLTANPEAMAFLIENLGDDRLVTRSELEKLALFSGGFEGGEAGQTKTVGLEDAMACIGDSAAMSLDLVAFATASGNAGALDRNLKKAFNEGTSPVGVLRAVGRHLERLHLVLGMVEGGATFDRALSSLRPPVFYKFKSEFQTQLNRWQTHRLTTALDLVTEAEIDCKTTGFPAAAGCHRALMRIAQSARAAQAARPAQA